MNTRKRTGVTIEFFGPEPKIKKGYDNKNGWSREQCMTPIYLEPETLTIINQKNQHKSNN